MALKILVLLGTRPEAIKLSPVIMELQKNSGRFEVVVCSSGQHREMLAPVLDFFGVPVHYDLDLMRAEQSLFDLTARTLQGMADVFGRCRPDWLVVQGDTTTAFGGALAAFYHGVRVAHVEAGLRTFNKQAPFPEEMNRVLIARLTDMHFAPTPLARDNLVREGIPADRIEVVGNTGIDALKICLRAEGRLQGADSSLNIEPGKRLIVVTGHRRESFGDTFRGICRALKRIASRGDVEIVYPVHLNPQVRKPVFEILKGTPSVHLVEPLPYPVFVRLLDRCYLVLTDSGGIQEEAPSLGKPVLVMRDVTERIEGIDAGTCRLAGVEESRIVQETERLLDDPDAYREMAFATNPYGDGTSSAKIVDILGNLC